jgi:hypothetical protein
MQEERTMAPITTIVHFEVPADNVDRFFAFWQDSVKDKVNKQPGLIDGIFHRGTDADGPSSSSTLLAGIAQNSWSPGFEPLARNCTERVWRWARSSRI